MKNILKYIICVILSVTFVSAFSGCGKSKDLSVEKPTINPPDKVVYNMLNSIRRGDYTNIKPFDGERLDDTINRQLYSAVFKNLDFMIISQAENDDASFDVTVELTNLDLSKITKNYDELDIDKAEVAKMTIKEKEDIIIEQINAVTKIKTSTVVVRLVKGFDEYQIINKGELISAASSGYIKNDTSITYNTTPVPEIAVEKSETTGPRGGPAGGPESMLGEIDEDFNNESNKNKTEKHKEDKEEDSSYIGE